MNEVETRAPSSDALANPLIIATMPKVRTPDPVFIDVPVPIRTRRLLLRPPTAGDGEAIARAVAESYDVLHPWFHDGLGTRAIESDPIWQEMIACRFRAQFAARERLPFYAFDAGTLCAFVELQPDWRVGRMRLSYWVRSSRMREGFGIEAVGALIRYAFDALDIRIVTVGHADGNTASARLIARLGCVSIPCWRDPLMRAAF